MGHVGPFQTVKAMLSLHEYFYQLGYFQAIQVYARGGWTHFSHHRELSARSCVAVHQAIEHACSCRLADGRRNARDGRVRMVLDIHALMMNELLIPSNCHTVN